ncbi:N-acetylmuramoyl-L-alanine amidase family protein [Paenibacillus protaetiae]|nr:N-acetylmuramoyl-L-alanine amidase family protein [Paenibacillus protaetiae]
MKKIALMLLFMSMFFPLFSGMGQAAESAAVVPKLFLNGQPLQASVPPQIVQGKYTVVPVRIVSENLGYQVGWQQDTKTVTIHNGQNEIVLQINDDSALVNHVPVQLDVPAMIDQGTTLIPLRFVGEQMGLAVNWDQATKSVYLTREEETDPVDEEEGDDPSADPGALISSVSYDSMEGLVVQYEGELHPNVPFKLDNPKRIVIDLPNTGYGPSALFAGAEVKLPVTDNPYLLGVRYSLFAKDPDTARLVLDLAEDADVVLDDSDPGKLRIQLGEPSGNNGSTGQQTDPSVPGVPAGDGQTSGGKVYTVVIDAGHGGTDPGARSVDGRWEKDLNLQISLKLKALLDQEKQIKVVLSRPEDKYVGLADRVTIAEQNKADIFISIHANSDPKGTATGTETYYTRESSKSLADVIHSHLVKGTGLKDRGVKQESLHVTRETTMPAILLETGFLTNQTDVNTVFDDKVQNRIAAEIVAGIKQYLKLS